MREPGTSGLTLQDLESEEQTQDPLHDKRYRTAEVGLLREYQRHHSDQGKDLPEAEAKIYDALSEHESEGLLGVHSAHDLKKMSREEWLATEEGQAMQAFWKEATINGIADDEREEFMRLSKIAEYFKRREERKRNN